MLQYAHFLLVHSYSGIILSTQSGASFNPRSSFDAPQGRDVIRVTPCKQDVLHPFPGTYCTKHVATRTQDTAVFYRREKSNVLGCFGSGKLKPLSNSLPLPVNALCVSMDTTLLVECSVSTQYPAVFYLCLKYRGKFCCNGVSGI